MINIGDTEIIKAAGSGTGTYPAYYVPVSAWLGLQVGSALSISRIANVTEDSGKTLSDDLIADAIAKFPAGRGPSFVVTGRRSWKQLQNSRTATNPTGAPAPLPESVFGLPLIVSDALVETEALVS